MRQPGLIAIAVALIAAAAVPVAASLLAGRIATAGFGSWYVATQAVWVAGAIAMLLLPLVILRRRVTAARARRPVAANA